MAKFFRKVTGWAVLNTLLLHSQVVATHAQVIINELYPNPNTGEQEWAELWNTGESAVDLTGWQLWDQLSSPSLAHTIAASTSLGAGEFLVISLSNVLNNTGDGLVLKNTAGDVVDTVSYTSSTKGKSWARDPDDLSVVFETEPTKGTVNPIHAPSPTPTPTPTPTKTSPSTSPLPSNTTGDDPAATDQPTANSSGNNASTTSSGFLYPPSVLKPKLSVEGPIFSDAANIAFSEHPDLERGALGVIMGSLFLLVPGFVYAKNRHPFS